MRGVDNKKWMEEQRSRDKNQGRKKVWNEAGKSERKEERDMN